MKRECPGIDYYVNFHEYLAGKEPARIVCYCGDEFTEEQYHTHSDYILNEGETPHSDYVLNEGETLDEILDEIHKNPPHCRLCGETYNPGAGRCFSFSESVHLQCKADKDSESRYLEAMARADNAEQTEW